MNSEQIKQMKIGMLVPVATAIYASKECSMKEAAAKAKELVDEIDLDSLILELNALLQS